MNFEEKRARACLLLAAVMFSTGGVFIRFCTLGAYALNGGRCAVAACVTLLHRKAAGQKLRVNAGVLCSALAACLTGFFYVQASTLLPAGIAITLQYTSGAFLVFLLYFFFAQKPAKSSLAAVLASFFGVWLTCAGEGGALSMLGVGLGLASGLCYALVFCANLWPEADAGSGYFLAQVLGAAVGLPFLLREMPIAGANFTAIILMGVFQMGLAYIFLARGLAHTPALTAGVITACEPALTCVWMFLLFAEHLSLKTIFGIALVLLAAAQQSKAASKDERALASTTSLKQKSGKL